MVTLDRSSPVTIVMEPEADWEVDGGHMGPPGHWVNSSRDQKSPQGLISQRDAGGVSLPDTMGEVVYGVTQGHIVSQRCDTTATKDEPPQSRYNMMR